MDERQQELVSWLHYMGADLVGFAPVERYANAPRHMHPQAHLPTAKTVIVIGVHHPDAAIERGGDPSPYHFGPYAIQGDMNTKLEHIGYHLARRLNASGFRSIAIPATNIWRFRPFAGHDNPFTPDLSDIHSAAAAGLGEIGLNGLFLSPEFGPRQRLECTITEAEFEPTPMYDGPELCDRCLACVEHCPTDAFRKETKGMSVVTIGERTFEYIHKNKWRCAWIEHFGFDAKLPVPDVIDESAAMQAFEEHGHYGGVMGRCLRFCLPPTLREQDEQYSIAPRRTKSPRTSVDTARLEALIGLEPGVALVTIDAKSLASQPEDADEHLPGCKAALMLGATKESAPLDQAFVDGVIAERLRHLTLDVTRVLESAGHESMPQPHHLGKPYSTLGLEALANEQVSQATGNASSWRWEPVLTTAALAASTMVSGKATAPSGGMDAAAVTTLAREAGADLVGIASVDRFENMPKLLAGMLDVADYEWEVQDRGRVHGAAIPEVHFDARFRFLGPWNYLPEPQSVIVIGLALPDVVLQRTAEEPARAAGPYAYLQYQTPKELVLLARNVTHQLRANGFHAAIALDLCRSASRVANPRGHQYDAWANRFAAVAAGLAVIGRHGAPITPEFGVNQRFISIVTDAPLEATPLPDRNWPCATCHACERACPVAAIAATTKTVTLPFGSVVAPAVDKPRCDWAKRYALVPEEGPACYGSKTDVRPPDGEVTADMVFRALRQTDPIQKHWTCVFENCLKACPGFEQP